MSPATLSNTGPGGISAGPGWAAPAPPTSGRTPRRGRAPLRRRRADRTLLALDTGPPSGVSAFRRRGAAAIRGSCGMTESCGLPIILLPDGTKVYIAGSACTRHWGIKVAPGTKAPMRVRTLHENRCPTLPINPHGRPLALRSAWWGWCSAWAAAGHVGPVVVWASPDGGEFILDASLLSRAFPPILWLWLQRAERAPGAETRCWKNAEMIRTLGLLQERNGAPGGDHPPCRELAGLGGGTRQASPGQHEPRDPGPDGCGHRR